MAKYPRLQFVVECKTCNVKFRFSVHFAEKEIWNHKDAGKLAEWAKHQQHDITVEYRFFLEG
jgi:hypothetical protein